MKRFHLAADAYFMAENIDDALVLLGNYFVSLGEEDPDDEFQSLFEAPGHIRLYSVQDKTFDTLTERNR